VGQAQKNNKIILVCCLLLGMAGFGVVSCATSLTRERPNTKPHSDVRFEEFSKIPLGMTISDVFSRFGNPQSAAFLPDADDYLLIYQNQPDGPQRYYFEFDREHKKLVGKTYEPLPGEEIKSFERLKAQFVGAEFYSPPLSMCDSHYSRNEGLVWIWGTGITLRVHPERMTVDSISWGPIEAKPRSPAQLPTGCPPPGPQAPARLIENPRSLL
jgi:hypothetical protein